MAVHELCFQSISQLATGIAGGDVSPVELTQTYLDRIQAVDSQLNSYITVTADHALREARQAERQIREQGPRGPLHGIPLAYKDLVATQGIKTTCGSRVLKDAVPDTDARVVERLRAAGAIMLGKLNMNEFATLIPSPYFGGVHNPWQLDLSPGGSSSGSGAAVAAGLCAGALGTDTGGSIRIPAALCGIVGLKPTHGRVSLFGITPLSWSLDHIGPMTRTVTDAALMLQVLAGYDARDWMSRPEPVADYTSRLTMSVKGLRLGIPTSFFPDATEPEVQSAFTAAVRVFADLGADLDTVTLPVLEIAWHTAQVIMQAEAYVWHEPLLRSRAEDYAPQVRTFLERGKALLATDYIQALQTKHHFRQAILTALEPFDALLTPGALVPAPRPEARAVVIEGRDVRLLRALVSATCPFNLTGQPTLTIPCGLSAAGLPLALQIVGKPFDEATVLQIGQAYETHSRWHEKHRPLPFPPPPEPLSQGNEEIRRGSG